MLGDLLVTITGSVLTRKNEEAGTRWHLNGSGRWAGYGMIAVLLSADRVKKQPLERASTSP